MGAESGGTALVTGACGFMGRALSQRLLGEGYRVRGTDLEDADQGGLDDGVEFVAADLTEPGTLDELVEGVDVVFHTAALFSYSSFVDWEDFRAVNVQGTENLCEAIIDDDTDIRSFVHWSTAGVYGAPESVPVSEDHPKNPESNYDKSKWMQEQAALRYHEEYGLPVKALRPAPVYGPHNTYGVAQLWFAIAKGYLQLFPSFCSYKLPLVHVDDVLESSLHIHGDGVPGEAYNVVDDQEYGLKDVVKYVAALTDSHVYGVPLGNRTYESLNALRRYVPYLERKYRDAGKQPPFERDALFYLKGNYWIDNTKIKDLGYSFSYPGYRKGLAETIEWYERRGLV